MSLRILSITIKTSQLQDMLQFYQYLGFRFEKTQILKGTELHRAVVNGVELTLYPVTNVLGRSSPCLQLGIRVDKIVDLVGQLKQVPGAICVLEPEELELGKKAIVIDPDGNSIELIQA